MLFQLLVYIIYLALILRTKIYIFYLFIEGLYIKLLTFRLLILSLSCFPLPCSAMHVAHFLNVCSSLAVCSLQTVKHLNLNSNSGHRYDTCCVVDFTGRSRGKRTFPPRTPKTVSFALEVLKASHWDPGNPSKEDGLGLYFATFVILPHFPVFTPELHPIASLGVKRISMERALTWFRD